LLVPGTRIDSAEISVLGQVGRAEVRVYRRPQVAVLSTGDEVVPVDAQPDANQIRDSNSYSMAVQIRRHGGNPLLLGNARDELGELESLLRRGLEEDLLVVTGGVSMGKHDLVKAVLGRLGAEIIFDAVAIRPGQPAVFASCEGKFVFGLPGNPVSTMVTLELFVAPALALLAGASAPPLRFLKARLEETVEQKTRLTMFLPACLHGEGDGVTMRAIPWQGSGDMMAVSRADCFLVVPDDVDRLDIGAWADVLLWRA
jgi:molybdopterin molybdotransferase